MTLVDTIHRYTGINSFSLGGKPESRDKIGRLPGYEDLKWDSENPDAQPSNPGVVIFRYAYYAANVFMCSCSRNLRDAKERLKKWGADILCSFPVFCRDSQGKRLHRQLRSTVTELSGNTTSFVFELKDATKIFIGDLATQCNVKPGDFKAVRQSMKALVRKAIHEVARKTGKKVMTSFEVIQETLPTVDGLSIDMYLDWLEADGLIKTRKTFDSINRRIQLL